MFGKVSVVGNVAGIIEEENRKRTIDVNFVSLWISDAPLVREINFAKFSLPGFLQK